MNLQKAKRLFFAFDGSLFHISRDLYGSPEAAYFEKQVPKSLRTAWLEELTALKLKELHSQRDRHVLSFLVHHEDKRHLEAVASAKPLGVFLDRCVYLELLLKYVKLSRGRYSAARLAKICDDVQQQALSLRRRVRADKSVSRVEQLLQEAKTLANEIRSR